jgi:tetratricopeptide (TPR) repeat protein
VPSTPMIIAIATRQDDARSLGRGHELRHGRRCTRWFYRFALLAIVGTVVQLTVPCVYSQTARLADTAEAQRLLDHGQFDDALKVLDTLAAQQPEPTGTERLRGMAFYGKGQMQSAEEAFAKAVAQDPADREAMQMEGVALFRMGRSAAAIPLLEKANLAIPGSNIDNNYVLGLCYLDTRRYDDARHAFAIQYHFPPDSASAYLLTARMMLRRDYLPTAESAAQKALVLSPNLPMAHLLLGQVRLARSQFPEALAEFEAERTLNPLFGEVYDRLGDTYIRTGEYLKAQEALDQAVLLEPTSPVPFILLGKVLLKERDLVMAQQYLQKALAIDPRSYIAHALLGQTYRSLGRTDQASHEFQLAEEIQAAAQPKIEPFK